MLHVIIYLDLPEVSLYFTFSNYCIASGALFPFSYGLGIQQSAYLPKTIASS